MPNRHVAIVGAGIGGLVAASQLAAKGFAVTVLEKAAAPGGKMREVAVDAVKIDAGPTVLTMRWIFEEIFAEAGSALEAHLTLRPASILARHAWNARERLDLFADVERSADAIGDFAGAREAAGYKAFAARSRRMFQMLDEPFMRAQRPRLDQLVASFGVRGLGNLRHISPFATMWSALQDHFQDPRLLQLFGRYATYCGSSPFNAPATLMLVAHAERQGVWLVDGGMYRVAEALAALTARVGGKLRYNAPVSRVAIEKGRASGVVLADGEHVAADAVLLNADTGGLTQGLFGAALTQAAPRVRLDQRSLSAITLALHAPTVGFPLVRHNVFFSHDYGKEFDNLRQGRVPVAPTVYVCAQDRGEGVQDPSGPERLLCLINAPPRGDIAPLTRSEIAECEDKTFARLEQCGLSIDHSARHRVTTDPAAFNNLFPGTGGALYGPASHGWQASFKRAGSRATPGLYLAGGSVHPGPGVPMVAISGRLAAAAIIEDLASTRPSLKTATPGGMSTPSAPTVPKR